MKIDAIAADYLERVRLRLLEESERERFDHLLETRYYLKSSRIGGRHLRLVAEVDCEWVALLMFSGVAPKLKGREKWIGWSPRQQARRLGLVCDNSLFLLLVQRDRHLNLAFKILSLALHRLAHDWQKTGDTMSSWWKVSSMKSATKAPATAPAGSRRWGPVPDFPPTRATTTPPRPAQAALPTRVAPRPP